MIQTIPQLAKKNGDENAYQFSKRTGVKMNNAYSIFASPSQIPTSRTMGLICRAYDCQPGDFLAYEPD